MELVEMKSIRTIFFLTKSIFRSQSVINKLATTPEERLNLNTSVLGNTKT